VKHLIAAAGGYNHRRRQEHNRIADALFFRSWYKPTSSARITSPRVNVKAASRQRYTGHNKLTDRPGSQPRLSRLTNRNKLLKARIIRQERKSLLFFCLICKSSFRGFALGLGVSWLHTGNPQHTAGAKTQAADPTKDTGPVVIVQYRANMKAGL